MKAIKERAKLAHFRAREHILNQKLEQADTAEIFTELMNDLSIVENHIECIQGQIDFGIKTKVQTEMTIQSRTLTEPL